MSLKDCLVIILSKVVSLGLSVILNKFLSELRRYSVTFPVKPPPLPKIISLVFFEEFAFCGLQFNNSRKTVKATKHESIVFFKSIGKRSYIKKSGKSEMEFNSNY